MDKKLIYTIGHSTRPIEEFLSLLQSFNIALVADVRQFPGSKKFPQYNQQELKEYLSMNNIQYIHFPDLGGRRKAEKESKNTAWRHAAFRGYADYMETEAFRQAIQRLEATALQRPTAYMCSEAVWWRCHRALISDYLKCHGWEVLHIMDPAKAKEHPYTAPANIRQGQLTYIP